MLARLPLALLFALGLSGTAAAQPADSAALDVRPDSASQTDVKQGEWTVEHVLKQESIGDVAIGPDGRRVLWTKRTPDFEKDRTTSDLHLTFAGATGEPETIRLTRTGDNGSPRWSHDGQTIAFFSSRKNPEAKEGDSGDEKRQIWLMDARGGEPRALTSLENPPERFRWLDSTRILFTAREAPTADEEAREEAKDDATAIEDTARFYAVRLFTVDVQSKEVRRLTANGHQIGEFEPDPSGRYVVYDLDTSPVDADARNQGLQYLLDLEADTTAEIFQGQYFDPSGYAWALDGSGFYASDERSSDPENEGAGISELFYYSLAERQYEKIPLGWPNGIGYGGYAVASDGVHVQLADGPRMKGRFFRKQGGAWPWTDVRDGRFAHSTSLTIGPDGETLAFSHSRPDSIPQYLIATYEGGDVREDREWTELNTYLQDLPMPKAEVVEWAGYDSATVNGILYYPLDYEPGRRYPLVVAIHGGPSGVDLDAWRLGWTIYPGLWAQRGAFLFRPNYHGSGHHGLEFVESIKGRYYELEVPDIVKGVEHLVNEGLVDPDSLGVMGWSNGAILTIALTIEHPELFKVASPGAGNVNWISDYGNCAFGVRFDDSYFGGAPWEETEHYIEKSPLFRMEEVVTPTLIQFGDEDTAVPTEQGWQHYRALQQIGKAPVRYVLYPGQGHGLSRPSHQKRKMEEDLAWFDTYLFGRTSMPQRIAERALPETAPLAMLEKRKAIARTGGRYGTDVRGVLAPETVTLGDTLDVGRFEVTRAQFRAFRPSYDVAPGTEDYPASGLSFEDAQAYVRWLGDTTGTPYRLPTEGELEALRSMAGPSENDLAYWAGYAPTPDERAMLEAKLEGASPDELLMEVGGRPAKRSGGDGAPLVFDVDGNVAEWAVGEEGVGVAMNASAVTVRDAKSAEEAAPPPAYVGLRVVRDND